MLLTVIGRLNELRAVGLHCGYTVKMAGPEILLLFTFSISVSGVLAISVQSHFVNSKWLPHNIYPLGYFYVLGKGT